MQVSYLMLAEGIARDARGAVTLVGVNQNVLSPPTLPTATKRAILLHLVGDPGEDFTGQHLTARFEIRAPGGTVVAAVQTDIGIGSTRWPHLPITVDIPAELVLTVAEFGEYVIHADVTFPDGTALTADQALYVEPWSQTFEDAEEPVL